MKHRKARITYYILFAFLTPSIFFGPVPTKAIEQTASSLGVRASQNIVVFGFINPKVITLGQENITFDVPVKNNGHTDILLNQQTSISFTDGNYYYFSYLSEPSLISVNGKAVLHFLSSDIDPDFTPGAYGLTLTMSGTDLNGVNYSNILAGCQKITIQRPADLVIGKPVLIRPGFLNGNPKKDAVITITLTNAGDSGIRIDKNTGFTYRVLNSLTNEKITDNFDYNLISRNSISINGGKTERIYLYLTCKSGSVSCPEAINFGMSVNYSDISTGAELSADLEPVPLIP
jgi:hypothetical protein